METEQKKVIQILYYALLITRIPLFVVVNFVLQSDSEIASADTVMSLIYTMVMALPMASFFFYGKSYKSSSYKNLSPQESLKKFQTLSVLSWALCEAIAVFGIVIYILTKDLQQANALIFSSVVLALFQKPNFQKFEKIISTNQ